MHKTAAEAVAFVHQFRHALVPHVSVEVLILPPFTSLHGIQEVLRPDDRFSLGAQDLHWESSGAYTQSFQTSYRVPTQLTWDFPKSGPI